MAQARYRTSNLPATRARIPSPRHELTYHGSVDEFGTERDGPDIGRAAGSRPALPPELNPRGSGRDPGKAPNKPKPKRTRRRRILTWAASSVAALVLLSSVTGYALVSHLLSGITHLNVFC